MAPPCSPRIEKTNAVEVVASIHAEQERELLTLGL